MKLILKLVAWPVVAALAIAVWIGSLILYCSGFLFGLAASAVGLLGLLVLATTSVRNGLILLLIAYGISPLGLPLLAALTVGSLNRLRWWIYDSVYSRP